MKQNKRIKINAISSILQTGTSAITLVILYRYLIDIIGVERFGIWSLVIGISSIVQLSNLGLTGSLIKYVADYDTANDHSGMSRAVQTGVLTIAALSLIIVSAGYPLGKYYLQITVPTALRAQAMEILPIALGAFWIMMLTNVYQSALYGCRKVAERNAVLIFESITHLGLCAILANRYGLLGLAYARAAINLVTLILTVAILKRGNKLIPIIPIKWDMSIFRMMLSYSLNMQFITILVMIGDPLTKGMLSRFGSPADVGYYEMANKVIQQIRALVVNSFQVMVPEFARLYSQNPEKIKDFYYAGSNFAFFVSLICYSTLIASVPLISQLWLGILNNMFMLAFCVLAFGWFFNTIAVPAYFANQGSGYLRDNVLSHVIASLLNVILGLLLGYQLGPVGVVIAWGLALAISGAYQSLMFQRSIKAKQITLIPPKSRLVYLVSVLGLSSAFYVFNNLQDMTLINQYIANNSLISTDLVKGIMVLATFILIVCYFFWNSPVRKDLLSRRLSPS